MGNNCCWKEKSKKDEKTNSNQTPANTNVVGNSIDDNTNVVGNSIDDNRQKEDTANVVGNSIDDNRQKEDTANVVGNSIEGDDSKKQEPNSPRHQEDSDYPNETTNVATEHPPNSNPPEWMNGCNGIGEANDFPPIPKTSVKELGSREARKMALLCGVSYGKGKNRLEGTLNDVKHFKELLISTFGFHDENIRVLTENELEQPRKQVKDQDRIPTKQNIKNSLKWLVEDCKSGDSLVFFFAGHGRQEKDVDMDEIDGMNEAICPFDFEKNGSILDDELNSTIVAPLIDGVKLHAIVDACHSGTILDLQHAYNCTKDTWEDHTPPNGRIKATKGGLAIAISACADDQEALNAKFGKKPSGLLTSFFVEAIKSKANVTYGELLDIIQNKIEQCKKPHENLLQKTQLSSSKEFGVYNTAIEL